jgi:hypothetical protein
LSLRSLTAPVAAAALIVTGAAAAADSVDSKLKLFFDPRDSGDYFSGIVLAVDPKCVKDRRVTIRYVEDHVKLGTAETNRNGEFELRYPGGGAAPSGTYKAVVKERTVASLVCAKDKDTLSESHDG